MPSDTYRGYGLIRSVLHGGSEADIADAVAYAQQIRLYPLSAADDSPETSWVDTSSAPFERRSPTIYASSSCWTEPSRPNRSCPATG